MDKKIIKTRKQHQSSIEKWYSEIVSKDEKDYSVEDICHMLRQDCFVDRAVHIGIRLLKEKPFIGSLYAGELLDGFLYEQKSYIYVYQKDFEEISSIAHKFLLENPNLLDVFIDDESVEEAKQLVIKLDNILDGTEVNLHLELIPQIIKRYFAIVSIGTNIANPEFKWRRMPFLPIVFDEKCSKRDAKKLNGVLKCFRGNCKWYLHRELFSKNRNLFFLTIRERYYPEMHKSSNVREAWEAAIEDILPLADHLEKSLANSDRN